jgi:hypothetical protein
VIRVVGEVGRGENFGEGSHEANDTPGASSGQVSAILVRIIIKLRAVSGARMALFSRQNRVGWARWWARRRGRAAFIRMKAGW